MFLGSDGTLMHCHLIVAEITLFKICYMFKYSRIAVMDEYFLAKFVTLFNIIILSGVTIIRISLQEHIRIRLYFQEFGTPYDVYKKVIVP